MTASTGPSTNCFHTRVVAVPDKIEAIAPVAVALFQKKAAIRDGGALGVMATYPAIDGIATHGSSYILTDILRHELGFEGLVLCEGGGLSTLVYEGIAQDQKQAGILALSAGVDVGISYEDAYLKPLAQSVREGLVSENLIDRAVRRILRQKFRLGLFEKPFVDAERAQEIVHRKEHQDVALQAAREGIVLLKNENQVLPLRKSAKSIAVIGPNADHEKNLLGDYTSITVTQDIVTILGVMRARSISHIHYLKASIIHHMAL